MLYTQQNSAYLFENFNSNFICSYGTLITMPNEWIVVLSERIRQIGQFARQTLEQPNIGGSCEICCVWRTYKVYFLLLCTISLFVLCCTQISSSTPHEAHDVCPSVLSNGTGRDGKDVCPSNDIHNSTK
jgi:hypothetical protein